MQHIDYTSRSRRFTARYPMLSMVMSYAGFWMLAHALVGLIIYLSGRNVAINFDLPFMDKPYTNILIGLMSGALYGTAIGVIDFYADKAWFRNKPLGKIIIFKTISTLIFLSLCFAVTRYVFFGVLFPERLQLDSEKGDLIWRNIFFIILIYSFFLTLVINFIMQVNKKFGPGVLLPILLGKYRNPKEEERVFMFMDLKSSTTLAEQLGHLRYSSFIRDAFADINSILNQYDAEIYQYVGDEIVISWKTAVLESFTTCMDFYFACQQQFELRRPYYQEQYGALPEFKAGIHKGKVSAVEIGEMKRDIAYHGDTLNIAARIQSLCNEYQQRLLTSREFLDAVSPDHTFTTMRIGDMILKGKSYPVEIWSVDRNYT